MKGNQWLLILLVAGIGFTGGGGDGWTTTAFAAEPACKAEESWVKNPSLPSEVENGREANNCDFHRFSWQSFLYGISDRSTKQISKSGEPTIFGDWMSDAGIFVPAGKAPTLWGETPPPPPTCKTTGEVKLILRQADRISGSAQIEAILEAVSAAPLVAQPRHGVGRQWVHFGIAVNKPMYDYLAKCDLYKLACFNSVAEKIDFPAESIEIKTAWKVVADAASATNYYTTTALVEPSEPPASARKCKKATVALVGFHLVRKTPLHPEWIWATFEHRDNAPDCKNPQPAPASGWSFNDPASKRAPNKYIDACTGTGKFDPDCVKLAAPTQVCRQNPWGGGNETNQGNIRSINGNVKSLLASDSVWRNYHMVGGIWNDITKNPPKPTGSLLAANTTAETYLQQTNCFGCHTSTPKHEAREEQADFSHIFHSLKDGKEECRAGLPPMCPSPQ